MALPLLLVPRLDGNGLWIETLIMCINLERTFQGSRPEEVTRLDNIQCCQAAPGLTLISVVEGGVRTGSEPGAASVPVGVGAGVVGTAAPPGVGAGPVGTAASPALVAGLAGRLGVGTLSGLGEMLLLGAREKLTLLSAFGVAGGLRALLRSDSAEVLRLGDGGATFSFSPSCLNKQSVAQVAPVPLPFAEGGAAGCLQLGLTWARSNLATSSFFVDGADFAAVARNPGSVFAGVCGDEAGEGGTAREGVTRRCVLDKRGLALPGLGTLLLGLAAKVSLVGLGLVSEPSASSVLALPAEGAGGLESAFALAGSTSSSEGAFTPGALTGGLDGAVTAGDFTAREEQLKEGETCKAQSHVATNTQSSLVCLYARLQLEAPALTDSVGHEVPLLSTALSASWNPPYMEPLYSKL